MNSSSKRPAGQIRGSPGSSLVAAAAATSGHSQNESRSRQDKTMTQYHGNQGESSGSKSVVEDVEAAEDDNDDDDEDNDNDGPFNPDDTTSTTTTDSIKLPPLMPLTAFWTPIVFHCPLPECDPDTLPMTNPLKVLDHLRHVHALEVVKPEQVMPFLERYIDGWAARIVARGGCVGGCGFIKQDCEDGKGYVFQIGFDGHEADTCFRKELQSAKLDEMLKTQDAERQNESNTSRKCLFCKLVYSNRAGLFQHMYDEHGFNIGLPDNLVNVAEFLNILEARMAGLRCLYCEKVFKSLAVLRKHMRKKKHFRVNPRNRDHDRFYIINYLEPGKNWEAYENEPYVSDEEKEDNPFDDWIEPDETERTMCLFDEVMFPSADEAVEHMKTSHGFDLRAISRERGLDFYGMIRLINYIRRSTLNGRCFVCCKGEFDVLQFSDSSLLSEHYKTHNNMMTLIPPKEDSIWSDSKLLFPTYDDDPLLSCDFFEVED